MMIEKIKLKNNGPTVEKRRRKEIKNLSISFDNKINNTNEIQEGSVFSFCFY